MEHRDLAAQPKVGEQSLLVNLLRLRQAAHGVGGLKAYRTDLTGFAAPWP